MYTFIESSAFERVYPLYLDDDEYTELQQYMMQKPEAGQIIPGSGGVRKLRWSRPGMGKRGGLTGYLLCAVRAERILDANCLCQSEARQRSGTHSETIVGGVSRWVRS